MATKGRSTQSLVNTFPPWANIRVDEQSLGFQFLNAIGKSFDDLYKQMDKIGKNYYLPTSVISDIDVFYRFALPGNYEFEKEDDDNTEFVYTPPTVSGVIDDINYTIQVAEKNNIETFWYTPAPDRISLQQISSGEHLLASGYFKQVLFNPDASLSGYLHIPNKITVEVNNGISFVGLQDNNVVRKTMVQIEGLTREGAKVTEELIFVHNETQQTLHEFKYIIDSGLKVFGAADSSVTTIKFSSANFNATDYAINYELDHTLYHEDMPLFWALGSGITSATQTLDLKKYDIDDLELRMEGFTTKHTIIQQELRNTIGSGIIPCDLAVEPNSDNIWVVDSGSLYLYNAAMPFPNINILQGKEYNAMSIIEPNTYYAVINEEIELNYIWRRPVTGFVCHRIWVQKPDGTKKSLEDGVEVTYHTDSTSWIYGEPIKRKIRNTEFYTLDQYGDYLYTLEVRYTDETTSIDKRIISVLYQDARAEFSLSEIGIPTTISGIDIDSENKLWVMDVSGVKYQLNKHYDRMLVDFKRKLLYFREPYDQIRIF